MKKGYSRLIGAAAVAMMLVSVSAAAQSWSKAEQEAWKAVETVWAADSSGNTAEFLSFFHDDYRGWPWGMRAPSTKRMVSKYFHWRHKNLTVNVYNLVPMSIIVKGNTAVAHYLFSRMTTNKDGKSEWIEGRWTDIMVKQGGSWKLIADAGGRTNDDDDDDDD